MTLAANRGSWGRRPGQLPRPGPPEGLAHPRRHPVLTPGEPPEPPHHPSAFPGKTRTGCRSLKAPPRTAPHSCVSTEPSECRGTRGTRGARACLGARGRGRASGWADPTRGTGHSRVTGGPVPLGGSCRRPSPPTAQCPPRDAATSLDGFLSTSPTPPPLRSPWLSTVTMHISRVSHVCSWSCSVSSAAGSSSAGTDGSRRNTVKPPRGADPFREAEVIWSALRASRPPLVSPARQNCPPTVASETPLLSRFRLQAQLLAGV